MIKKLRLKFIAANMTIVTIILGIIFGVVFFTTYRNLEMDSVRMMQMVARDGRPARPGRPVDGTEEIRLPFFTLDVLASGDVVAVGGGYYDLSDEEFLDSLVATARSSEERLGIVEEYHLRYLRVEHNGGERLVFADMSSERNTIGHLVRTCLLIGLASFFIFLLISIFLAHWAVKPVEKAWEQQRQFVADASHELKTPLAVITTSAELLQDGACGEAARGQFVGSILTMSRQMRALIESLLNLARVDERGEKNDFEALDLSSLLAEALLPFEPVFFERGLSLAAHIEDGLRVKGSVGELRQVAEILLDNAQKYAAAQGEISIELKRQDRGHCLLRVTNPGEEISADDLKNIFKRFYRIDKARTRDGSYGLGLSIAESIVHAHRGKIWAESAGGQNSFFVQLLLL